MNGYVVLIDGKGRKRLVNTILVREVRPLVGSHGASVDDACEIVFAKDHVITTPLSVDSVLTLFAQASGAEKGFLTLKAEPKRKVAAKPPVERQRGRRP